MYGDARHLELERVALMLHVWLRTRTDSQLETFECIGEFVGQHVSTCRFHVMGRTLDWELQFVDRDASLILETIGGA